MLNFEDSSLRGSYARLPPKHKENTSHTAQDKQEVFTKPVSIKLGRFKLFWTTSKINSGALPRRSSQLAKHISQVSFTFPM